MGQQLPFIGPRMNGGKSIDSKSEPTKGGRVNGHFLGTGRDDIKRGIVRSIAPLFLVQTGSNQGLAKSSIKSTIPPSRHEKDIRALASFFVKPGGGSNVNVGCPKIGMGQGGVNMLFGKIWFHLNRRGPIQIVL